MTGLDFVFLNDQATVLPGGTLVTPIPFVAALDHQNAIQQSGRGPGGGAANGASNIVSNNVALLDDMVTRCDKLPYAKNGVFHVTTTSTTPVNIDLTNLTTNATSSAGDTVFATVNQLLFYNLSGVDGVAAASMSIAAGTSNGARLQITGTTPAITLPASSRTVQEDVAGFAVDSTHKILVVTPTAGGNFAMVVSGA